MIQNGRAKKKRKAGMLWARPLIARIAPEELSTLYTYCTEHYSTQLSINNRGATSYLSLIS